MNRDKFLEKKLMLASVAELNIRNNIFSDSIQQFMPVNLCDGKPTSHDGKVQLLPREPYCDPINPITEIGFELQQNCNPTVTEYVPNALYIMNQQPCLQTRFFMLRMLEIYTRHSSPDLIHPPFCFDLDYQNAAHIEKAHNYNGGWDSASVMDGGSWRYLSARQNLPAYDRNSFYMNVYDSKDVFAFTLRVIINDYYNYIVLPVAYFQHPLYAGLLELYLPPKPSCYTLLGASLLAESPNAPICITNDFAFYMRNINNSEILFLLNVGGDAWVDKLNLGFLEKHKVFCHAWDNDKASMESALKTAEKLCNTRINPVFYITSKTSEPNRCLETNNTSRWLL